MSEPRQRPAILVQCHAMTARTSHHSSFCPLIVIILCLLPRSSASCFVFLLVYLACIPAHPRLHSHPANRSAAADPLSLPTLPFSASHSLRVDSLNRPQRSIVIFPLSHIPSVHRNLPDAHPIASRRRSHPQCLRPSERAPPMSNPTTTTAHHTPAPPTPPNPGAPAAPPCDATRPRRLPCRPHGQHRLLSGDRRGDPRQARARR